MTAGTATTVTVQNPIPIQLDTSTMKSKLRLLLPLVLLLGAGFWGFQRWSFARMHESTDNAQVDGHIVPVVAKVGGYVTRVAVNENGRVADSGLLVTLDEREYQVRLAQAEADLSAALPPRAMAVARARRWPRCEPHRASARSVTRR